uniref:Uncharacterized protein n=1 Tax=Rangifer tarandus platyrhynchus TaxID=3082113 RepID=A0ACB0E8A6_RANTA|nr:unnamed protein product [Rangifer tarandus platyrhynchus]
MVVPLPTPTQRQMWSRKKRRFFSDGLGCGTSVRDAARRGRDPAPGTAVAACRRDSSRSPRGRSGPARSSRLFLGRHRMRSTRQPARAAVQPEADRVRFPEPSQSAGAVPVHRGVRSCQAGPEALQPSWWSGAMRRGGRLQGRTRGVHTSLGTSLGNRIVPQLEHIHSHCKQAENCLLEAVPKLSPVPPGIQGARGSALSSFLLRQSLY